MSTLVVRGPGTVEGNVSVPGDKSISHRALMLGAASAGRTTVRDLAPGADVSSTIACLEAYGVSIDRSGATVTLDGGGVASWNAPDAVLDCGNSGTTMRLLAGFAAHREFVSRFDGDASLRSRPMDRVARPLDAMGARVETESGFPPMTVAGGGLRGTEIVPDVASAQVKSCVLLAALGADGPTVLIERALTRDHTERMLRALGVGLREDRHGDGCRIEIEPSALPAFDLRVPGDASSAAFLVGAAVLCGPVRIDGVGLNPSRLGFLEALRNMGAAVSYEGVEERMNETVGSIDADRSDLRGITIHERDVPTLHDELPLLAVLASQAEGETLVRGAGELRVKETDRITATVAGLKRLGADTEELPDGFIVRGPTALTGAVVDAAGDHRIAMAFAVAGLAAQGETHIEGFDSADVSWPGFDQVLAGLGADVEVR